MFGSSPKDRELAVNAMLLRKENHFMHRDSRKKHTVEEREKSLR